MLIDQFVAQPHAYANAHTLYPYADKVVRDDHIKKLSLQQRGYPSFPIPVRLDC